MKKIFKLSLTIFIMILVMVGSVYAVSGNVIMQASETTVKPKEQFTVEISLSNISAEVITFGGVLKYEKDDLTLIEIKGENGWETPTEGISYNSSDGVIAIERNKQGTGDEVVIKMTFEVKDTTKTSTTIELNDVMVADGKTTPLEIGNISKSITIKPSSTSTTTPDDSSSDKQDNSQGGTSNTPSGTSESQKDTNNNKSNTTSVKDNTTVQNKNLPYTGISMNYIVIILIAFIVLISISIVMFLKLRF